MLCGGCLGNRWGLTSELGQAGGVCHCHHLPAMGPRPHNPCPLWTVDGPCCMGLPPLRLWTPSPQCSPPSPFPFPGVSQGLCPPCGSRHRPMIADIGRPSPREAMCSGLLPSGWLLLQLRPQVRNRYSQILQYLPLPGGDPGQRPNKDTTTGTRVDAHIHVHMWKYPPARSQILGPSAILSSRKAQPG